MTSHSRIKTQCFSGKIHQNIEINIDRYVTQPDWLYQLGRLCSESNPRLFDAHVGPRSGYQYKADLLKTLKFHYAVLSGALNQDHPQFAFSPSQKQAIILKLTERYDACPPGYHNRANSVLESYFQPKTINELFLTIRQDIVERVANQNTADVHEKNRFFVVAVKMGYNVKPSLPEDYYSGGIPDHVIQEKLSAAFKEAFQPFSILLGIKERLSAPFLYVGKKIDGYKINEYMPGLEYLKTLFNENDVNYDYLVVDEDSGAIQDIHWNNILLAFWDRLVNNGYFDYDETWKHYFKKHKVLAFFGSVVDQMSNKKNHKDEVQLVRQIFSDPLYADTENCPLITLNTFLPTETECLAYLQCNPNLSNRAKLNIIFNFMAGSSAANTNEHYKADAFWRFSLQNPELFALFSRELKEKYPVIATRIKNAIIREDKLISLLSTRTTSSDALKILLQQLSLDYFTRSEIIVELSKTSWGNNNNILMLALMHHPKFFDQLLAKANEFNILSRLLAPNHYHFSCLSWALEHQPQLFPKIFLICLELETTTQRNIFQSCLEKANRLNSGFKPLLLLNQKVDQLSLRRDRKEAFNAAQQLQNTLINLLLEPDFDAIKPRWDAAIAEARLVLGKYRGWKTLLTNLALITISIPLLGLPLIARYYSKQCKYVLFQSQTTHLLDNLENINNSILRQPQSSIRV